MIELEVAKKYQLANTDSKLPSMSWKTYLFGSYPTPIWTQSFLLIERQMKMNFRTFSMIGIRLILSITMALALGTVYYDLNNDIDKTSGIFFILAYLVVSSIAVMPVLIEQRNMLVREIR